MRYTTFHSLKRLKAAALIAREQRAGAETKLELDN